jgi:glycerol-3-phosphate dehydrogenase subunit B
MFDVLVIGGGLAGTVAALTARARGAKVALASRSWGATALSTGALDVAYSPALSPAAQMPRSVAEHVMDIVAHRPRHPYGVLGLEATLRGLRQGFGHLEKALATTGLTVTPLDLEAENRGTPSSLGTVLPAAATLSSHAGLDLAKPQHGRWAVAQLQGAGFFDARRVALGLAHDAEAQSGVCPALEPVLVAYEAGRNPIATARALDDMAAVERLGVALRERADGLAGFIVPPVVGLDRHVEALRRLREVVGVPVIEALANLPSPPGVRLQRALEAAVTRAGVELVGDIAAPVTEGERVTAVRTSDALEIRAGSFVLATGRFVAGGVTWTDRCRESLFGLPVVTELGPMEAESPTGVVRETPVESHPLLTAGVPVGRDLRPQREGHLAFVNLFAAGMIIGGFASRYALCADGVALATGTVAAEGALAALEAEAA